MVIDKEPFSSVSWKVDSVDGYGIFSDSESYRRSELYFLVHFVISVMW